MTDRSRKQRTVHSFAADHDIDWAIVFFLYLFMHSGCSLVAKAPALGAGDRQFESGHPEFNLFLYNHLRRGVFLCLSRKRLL